MEPGKSVGYFSFERIVFSFLLFINVMVKSAAKASGSSSSSVFLKTVKDFHQPMTKVKNRTPSPKQITAEQTRQLQHLKITDSSDEVEDYRLCERKEFEELLRSSSSDFRTWIKYAQWETSQKDFGRARSIWERALEVDSRNPTLWLKYAEMEMKNKLFINHARNVWNRAVALLPNVDQLWYEYILMEEMQGNVVGARQIFEQWIRCLPEQKTNWVSYIEFELRYREIKRAEAIFRRFVPQYHSRTGFWIKTVKFEIKDGELGNTSRARSSYERALEKLAAADEAERLQLLPGYLAFQELNKESERPKCTYEFAI